MKNLFTTKRIIYSLLIFILVASICSYVNFNYANTSDYQESIHNLEKVIEIKSSTITDEGFVMTTLESLKILSFINFCNILDQKLLSINLIFILSILFIAIRIHFQKLFNKLNITVILPKLSISCILIYTFWIFTFSPKISIIQIFLIYFYIILSLELIKQIRINSKANIKSNSKHDNIDLFLVALIPLTMIGFKAIPMTYLILGTIPYSIYAYIKISKISKVQYTA